MSTRTMNARPALRTRPVASSVDELLAGATLREPMDKAAESLSGSVFERVVIGGRPHVLKHLHVDDDWIQRATGDMTCRPLLTWRSGLFDALPSCIDHATVGVAGGLGRNGWGAAVLMRDVSPWLVRIEDGIPESQHLGFLDHMAQLHAAFWGWRDTVGLLPIHGRYNFLSPRTSQIEAERGATDVVPRLFVRGWDRLAAEAPSAWRVVAPLVENDAPLVDALLRTPQTLVHGDWKAGNLGSLPDGRTILLDWAVHGEAPACADIAWYVSVNCDLLPTSKEDTIAAYRDAVGRHGVDVSGWWDAQLGLCMVGAFAQMGWSKSGDELAWWEERVPVWARYLDR